MITLDGKSVYEGIVIGEIYIHNPKIFSDKNKKILPEEVDNEVLRFEKVLASAKNKLENLKYSLDKKIDSKNLEMIDAHLWILKDPVFVKDIVSSIKKELNTTEEAIINICTKYVKMFENIDSPVYKQRGLDVKDVSKRLLEISASENEDYREIDGKILVAKEIYPTQLLDMYSKGIQLKGIIMEYGGETSHVSILAKTLKIPTLVGVNNIFAVKWSKIVILDTLENSSHVYIDPLEEDIENYRKKREILLGIIEKMKQATKMPAVTRDNKKINIYLNIGGTKKKDFDEVKSSMVSGVGLLRTELVYMESHEIPSEEEQYRIYKELLENYDNEQEIVIRTLDIGADKQLPYFKMENEGNPFLGLRGVRLSLQHKEMFKSQLRAILRLSNEKNIKIMYPMITNVSEVLEANKVLEEVKIELDNKNILYNKNIEVGIMVEVPSVILMCDQFAKYVDFFSIGSNDLTQYILATDRLSETVGYVYDSLNPAILRAINILKEAADRAGKKVSICGEMAGDIKSMVTLIALGITNLSMISSSVPRAKYIIRNLNFSELQNEKDNILNAENSKRVREIIKKYIQY